MSAALPWFPIERGSSAVRTHSRRADAVRWTAGLHDELTALFGHLDRGGTFSEDRWEHPAGDCGVSRAMTDGVTFEKAAVNRSVMMGELPELTVRRLDGRGVLTGVTHFFATGVSVVVHPRSPLVPTVHLNVGYFELTDERETLRDAWFGGSTDLTPFYPFDEDAQHFHCALRDGCNRHHASFYPEFKRQCDEYFTNAHRAGEARGIGGIFFDQLRADDPAHGLGFDELSAFVTDVARVLRIAYAPIVERRRTESFGERERAFQLVRRGRYVEFNLVHDRGTLLGLQPHARVENVLMSLPPVAMWPHSPSYAPDSFEARLIAMLESRDWVGVESARD